MSLVTSPTATVTPTADHPTTGLLSKPQEASPPPTPSSQNIILPPTPTTSDDEDEQEQLTADDERESEIPSHISDKKMAEEIIQKNIKLQRRGTVSLADLIPMASAALRAKQCLLEDAQGHAAASQQNSTLARALTKVKLGLQSHRLKEKYLMNEWKRLAFGLPIDESTINNTCNNYLISAFSKYSPLYNSYDTTISASGKRCSSRRMSIMEISNTNSSSNSNSNDNATSSVQRTKEIVSWYEHYFKRTTLSIQELEARVDRLRQQKLLLHQQLLLEQQEQDGTSSSCSHSIPSASSNGNINRTKRSYSSSVKKEPHAYSSPTTIASN